MRADQRIGFGEAVFRISPLFGVEMWKHAG